MQQYYYQQLTKPQKSVYDALLAAVSAFAPSVRVLHLSPEEMRDVYCLLRLDHPGIIPVRTMQSCTRFICWTRESCANSSRR